MNEIPYKLSAEELYQGLVAIARTRVITKAFKIVSMILLATVVFTTVFMLKNGNFTPSTGLVVTGILAIYGYFLAEISAKVQAPSIIKAKGPLAQPLKLSIHKTYYVLTGENFTHRLTYDKLHSAVETEDFFLLKTSEGAGNILPKRAFTPEQIRNFKAILEGVQGLKLKLI